MSLCFLCLTPCPRGTKEGNEHLLGSPYVPGTEPLHSISFYPQNNPAVPTLGLHPTGGETEALRLEPSWHTAVRVTGQWLSRVWDLEVQSMSGDSCPPSGRVNLGLVKSNKME